MELINKPGYSFIDYVRAIRGMYGQDLPSMIHYSNKEIFNMRKNPTPWFMSVPHSKIQVGKFYLILYNFNDNRIYCPIFTVDYRVKESGKHVMYAINLDYLPFEYKARYFNDLYSKITDTFNFNKDAKNFMDEKPIPVNFEQIYKSLKNNGDFNFAISAFDITKIIELFGVSTNLMYLMVHIHMRPLNVELMKELMKKYENNAEKKEKLEKIINRLEEMHQTYDDDIKTYYKKLRNLEVNYKLFD